MIIAAVMQIYTDAASTIGFGCYFNGLWFAEKWFPHILAQVKTLHTISIAFLELYPTVVTAVIWGK